ncbi:catalase [Tahibacter aquaticus]|uniref:Catalase n=1 Tax=Tahibacter aquaticus TaxID=520092 RepID=A0A4R6YM86_9GAMM|nr:catalase family protein [Tahibacter aquaticus]TDR38349.1 catalase [Tahibacter aquaticus]
MLTIASLLCARLSGGIAGIMTIGHCAAVAIPETSAQTPDASAYPTADATLGEVLFPNESSMAEQISLAIEDTIRRDYAPGSARRDAHPKAHGCVKAEFAVAASLPKSLVHGVFIPGTTYSAWIRFSNGNKDATRADIKGDARGMAIKLLDVPGKKLLDAVDQATTQDFILISHPVFFANDPNRYLSLIRDGSSGGVFATLRIPFDLGFRGLMIARKTASKTISNPLQTRYWSTVPYQLGVGDDRQAVKYSVRSCAATLDPIPKKPGNDYLRGALRASLETGDACMEFLVQPRTSPRMGVEDVMTEWDESDAPSYPVASIRIPRQTFDTPEQNAFCEALSFNPWHALPAHKPLGVMNRLRKVIYERISQVRHAMNAVGMRSAIPLESATALSTASPPQAIAVPPRHGRIRSP